MPFPFLTLPPRPSTFSWRWPALLALIIFVCLALRLPWLGALPNPSGDEGNWTLFGLAVLDGHSPQMAPDARFVSTLFARLIALSFRLFGLSFASARAVLVVGLTLSSIAAALTARRLGLPRAGLIIAALLAVHPWSVLWSRTVTVPYALALGLAVLGPLLVVLAARTGTALAMILAGQCLALAIHFTPLALIPIVASLLWLVTSPYRARLARPAAWVAAALASLHLVPVLYGAAAVVSERRLQPARWLIRLGARLHVFALTVGGGWTGEASLRHFTGEPVARPVEWALAALALALLLYALRPAARSPAATDLARFVRIHLVVAVFGLPLLLATARPWNLPAIDTDRYLFATLAPFVLALGVLAESPSRLARHLPALAALYFLVSPTQRAARFFLAGGSPDAGFFTLAGGGGYRGWKTSRERVALPVQLRAEVDRLRGPRRALVLMADYALHPLQFVNQRGGSWCHDVSLGPPPEVPGALIVFITWSDGLLGPTFGPPDELAHYRQLRALMHSDRYRALHRERVWVQPDGSPLIELWSAERAD